MFSGIALFSVLTAALGTFFVSRLRTQDDRSKTGEASSVDPDWSAVLERLASIEAALARLEDPHTAEPSQRRGLGGDALVHNNPSP
jgi:hypothetical protein